MRNCSFVHGHTQNTRVLGSSRVFALDFDLQAHCHGWKVKEGSDSSSPAAESQEGLISYSNLAYICLLGFSSISVMQGT